MKKYFFSFVSCAAIFAAALTVSLSGCSFEDPAEPLEVDMTRTATIEGTLLWNNNTSTIPPNPAQSPSTTNPARVPTYTAPPAASINIVATIPYSALNPSASGIYTVPQSDITYSATDGKFTVKVPVGIDQSFNVVTINVSSFIGTRTVEDLSLPPDANPPRATKTQTGSWSLNGGPIVVPNVVAGTTALLPSNTHRLLNFQEGTAVGDNAP